MRVAASSVGEALKNLSSALAPVAKEESAQQARLLIAHALGVSTGALLSLYASPMPEEAGEKLHAYWARRLLGEPLQYILGEWEFMGLPFYVEPAALIPRQDTETLAEHGIALIKARGYQTALDLCCGTGCIGISLRKLSDVAVTLADISPACLALARKNAARNEADVSFCESDLFGAVSGKFDLIACNPPYIETGALDGLQREVQFEPRLALDGGADGLCFYRRIAAGYKNHIALGGALLLEVGVRQAAQVAALFENASTIKDISGIDRVVAVLA